MLTKNEKSIVLLHGIFKPAIFDLLKEKKAKEIFILEGRPSLESSRVGSRELLRRKLKPTLIADNMAGFLFNRNLVKEVRLSYQLSDDNGALCTIGALILGVLAKKHNVPVNLYPSGKATKLLGNQAEIFSFNGVKVAPNKIQGYVPLVEWLPKKYITKIYE